MRVFIAVLILLSIILSGCTKEEEKQFADELMKQAVNQTVHNLNPLKNASSGEKCDDSFDTKYECRYDSGYYTIVKTSCVNGIKTETILGPGYDYCDGGYYRRIWCDSYIMRDSGQIDQNTYCLVQNTKVGKAYCRSGEIKREITDCPARTTCILTQKGDNECVQNPTPESPFRPCDLDFKGRCPDYCTTYFGTCVYPP